MILEKAHEMIREKNSFEDGAFKIIKLAGDASLRKYYRLFEDKKSYVLMLTDAFDESKNDFLLVQTHLENCKVPVPKVLGVAAEKGAILLEDLGDRTMLHALGDKDGPAREIELFKEAISLLVEFHSKTKKNPQNVPGYSLAFDEEKLMWEVDFTLEHLFGSYLKRTIPQKEFTFMRDSFVDICKKLAAEPRVFTHRDYHSRNIMISNKKMFCIDFQDARMGLRAYDLASILRDSYYQLSEENVYALVAHYVSEVEKIEKVKLDPAHFIKMFDLMSIQRNFKAIGSFTSFYGKRNDSNYIRFVGNTFENIRRNLRKFPEYSELSRLLFHYYYF